MSLKRLSRQKSVMSIESNPLEGGAAVNTLNLQVENLSDAVPIGAEELKSLLLQMKATEVNEERLQILDGAKTPFLFSSENLVKILDVTTSLKTKIAIITAIGPRLTDPRAKSEYFIALFRFAEEKQVVEEILKQRTQALASALFNKGDQLKATLAGGRGGAGRGGAGRGPGVAGRGAGRGPAASGGAGRGRGAGPGEGSTNITQSMHNMATSSTEELNPPPTLSPRSSLSKGKSIKAKSDTNMLGPDTVTAPVTPKNSNKVGLLSTYAKAENTPETMNNLSNPSMLDTPDDAGPLMVASPSACPFEHVFDMLDNMSTNPSAPTPVSESKRPASKRYEAVMVTVAEDEDDEEASNRNTPLPETIDVVVPAAAAPSLASVSNTASAGIAIETTKTTKLANTVSNEALLGPETNTPRTESSSQGGDLTPASGPTLVQFDVRSPVAPSPVVKEETLYETESLKMILETKSSMKTNVRIEMRSDASSTQHYHEVSSPVTPGLVRRPSINTPAADSDVSNLTKANLGAATPAAHNAAAMTPSSTVAAPAETPRTYDRAAMLRRLQSGGDLHNGGSDFSSPVKTPSGPILTVPAEAVPVVAPESIRKDLFGAGTSGGEMSPKPDSGASRSLNLGALNSSPRKHGHQSMAETSSDVRFAAETNETTYSNVSEGSSSKSLDNFFDVPSLALDSPQQPNKDPGNTNQGSAMPSVSMSTISDTTTTSTKSETTPVVIPTHDSPKIKEVQAAAVPVVSKVEEHDVSLPISTVVPPELPPTAKSEVSASNSTATSTSVSANTSTKSTGVVSGGSSRVPFSSAATPSEPITTTEEEVPAPTVNFSALRSAFAKNDSTSSNAGPSSTGSSPVKIALANRRQSVGGVSTSSSFSTAAGTPNSSQSPAVPAAAVPKFTAGGTVLASSTHSRRHSMSEVPAVSLIEKPLTGAAISTGSDVVSKCAAALNIDKVTFLALTVEEGWQSDTPDGTVALYFSYRELVRRNFTKEYQDLAKGELEKYLCDSEFAVVFGKSKELFFAQPRWKQMDQKKKAMLF